MPSDPTPPLGGRRGAQDCDGGRVTKRAVTSGAAGSRTRVPRPRRRGLYVRRFRMISDPVLRRQAASGIHTTTDFPLGQAVTTFGVEPRDVDPTPLRGLEGGSSLRFRQRVPDQSWQLWFPRRINEGARASSARSLADGMTTVETVSAPRVRGRARGPDEVRSGATAAGSQVVLRRSGVVNADEGTAHRGHRTVSKGPNGPRTHPGRSPDARWPRMRPGRLHSNG